MAPKKKVRLTKAERALKKLEAVRQVRRDLLEREIQHGVLNWRILQKKWRQLLIEMRLPEFWQDVKTMWHKFDNVVDLKDFMLSCQMDELDEAEVQHNVNLRAHVESCDELIAFFGLRLDELHDEYLREVGELTTTSTEAVQEDAARQDNDEMYVKEIRYIMEQQMATEDTNANVVYLSTTDEEALKYADMLQLLRSTLERTMELMWTRFKSVLQEYNDDTEDRRKLYLEYKAKDDLNLNILNSQLIRTQKLFASIKRDKEVLAGSEEARALMLADLHFEHQFFTETYSALRARLKKERDHDSRQLILQTTESDKVIKVMKNTAKKGERLLTLAAICRKMETPAEKVTPFPGCSSDDYDEAYRIAVMSSDNLLKLHDDFSDMSLFWLRVGEAETKRVLLKAQLRDLRREHEELCCRLRSYLTSGVEPTSTWQQRPSRVQMQEGASPIKLQEHPFVPSVQEPPSL